MNEVKEKPDSVLKGRMDSQPVLPESAGEGDIAVLEEFEQILAPCVPGLLRDSRGGLALDRFPQGSESEFLEFLAEQLSINDGFSFRDPVASLVKEVRFRPLVKALYDRARGLPIEDVAPQLLAKFQSAMINLDAQGFVRRLWGSEGGIEKLQGILENASGDYSNEVLAELNKGVSAAYHQDKHALSHVMDERMHQVFSRWNFWNWDIRKEELSRAKEISAWMMDRVQDFRHERGRNSETKNLRGTPLFNGGLKGKRVGPEDHARMQSLIEQNSSRTDALSLSRTALAKLWCFAAENSNWIAETLGDTTPARLYILRGAEALLEEAKGVHSPEAFKAYNDKLQNFLKGPVADEEKNSWLLWLQDVTVGAGLPAALEKMQPDLRDPFDQLLESSDKWMHAIEMGVRLGPETESDLKLQDSKEALIRSLEDLKGGLWHGYKRQGLISRTRSAWADEVLQSGNKWNIEQAIGEVQGLMEDIRTVENFEDHQKAMVRLTSALKPGGKLNRGLKAAEMDGVENVLAQVDQAAEILAVALVTEGAGTGVAVARLMKAGSDFKTALTVAKGMRSATNAVTQASRLEKAYAGAKAGATNSLVHNTVSKATGQVRQGDDTAVNWIKDATATGLASGMTGVFAKASVATGNPLKNILARYTTGGFKLFHHWAADAAGETLEEIVDQSLRQSLNGEFQGFAWKDLTEIALISGGGGFTKMGALAETFGRSKARLGTAENNKRDLIRKPSSFRRSGLPSIVKMGGLAAGLATLAISTTSEAAVSQTDFSNHANLLQFGLGSLVMGGVFSKLLEWLRSPREDSPQKPSLALPQHVESNEESENPYRSNPNLSLRSEAKLAPVESPIELSSLIRGMISVFQKFVSKNRYSYTLAEQREVNGILLPKGTEICFMGDGNLDYADLPVDFTIGGARFQSGMVEFAPQQVQGTLASDQWFNGRFFLEDSSVLLKHGKVLVYSPSRDVVIDGIQVVGRSWIEFWESGHVRSLYLHSSQVVQGARLPAGVGLHFDPEGELLEITARNPQDGTRYCMVVRDGKLLLHEDTRPWAQKLLIPSGTQVVLDDRSGQLDYCILNQDWERNGILYKAGAKIKIKHGVRLETFEVELLEGEYEELPPGSGDPKTTHHVL